MAIYASLELLPEASQKRAVRLPLNLTAIIVECFLQYAIYFLEAPLSGAEIRRDMGILSLC